MAKKKHWTQTREGKKKLKLALKKHWKTRRAKTDEEFDQSEVDIEVEKPAKKRPKVVKKSSSPTETTNELLVRVFANRFGWEVLAKDDFARVMIVSVPLE